MAFEHDQTKCSCTKNQEQAVQKSNLRSHVSQQGDFDDGNHNEKGKDEPTHALWKDRAQGQTRCFHETSHQIEALNGLP